MGRMKSLVGLNHAETKPSKSRHAEINIFTVASGLLYEVGPAIRFDSISSE
jgi:UDP-glucose:glycoprotein glucosyltransferase